MATEVIHFLLRIIFLYRKVNKDITNVKLKFNIEIFSF